MTIRDFFKIWGAEMLLTLFSAILLIAFWVGYALYFDGQSAMVPAAGIKIFWALFKFTIFSTFGHFVTFIYCSRYAKAEKLKTEGHAHPDYLPVAYVCDPNTRLKVWAIVVVSLSLCSLG